MLLLIAWVALATLNSSHKGHAMKHRNHTQHYTPAPVASDEPHPLAVAAGAVVLAAGLYLMTVVLFSL